MQETPFGQVLIREIETFNLRLAQYKLLRIKAKREETDQGVAEDVKKTLTFLIDEIKISTIQINDRLVAAAKVLKLEKVKKDAIIELGKQITETEFPELTALEVYSYTVNEIYANELSGIQNVSGKVKELT